MMGKWKLRGVAALLGALAFSVSTAAQSMPDAPVSGEGQCLDDDCTTSLRNPGDNGPAPAAAENQAATEQHNGPMPVGRNDRNNTQEPNQMGEPDRIGKQIYGWNETLPGRPPSEFEGFVASSVGRRLPIYGASLFDYVPSTFAPVDRIPVTDDYEIGPGDEILIRVWGQVDLNGKLVVDRGGEVFLPKVGALFVAGLRYQQLPGYFRTAIGRVFRNFDLTISLGQLRSIQVFVVGEARRPGSYTVSSLCTLVNALFVSGGPSAAGSMRHIQLKRENRVTTEFDFYDLLLRGDKSKDAKLLPGDVIYIPAVGPSIAVAGSVNLPAIYELREGTTLADAIEMAGGFATTADGQKAVVERIENHSSRQVEEFPLDGADRARVLKDGDLVRIFSLSPRFQNAITLRGNVARPGRMEWHPGMRLKDVIPNQDALITRDYWRSTNWVAGAGERREEQTTRDYWQATAAPVKPQKRAGQPLFAEAGRNANPEINPEDQDNQDNRQGEARAHQADEQASAAKAATESMTAKLRNRITRNAPEINWEYAVIQRLNPRDLTTQLIPFDLGKLVLQGDEQNNLALEPGDVITIFSQNDLAVPLEKRSKFVRLEGEFQTAGVYQAEPGETLRHLVERAGAFTANAYMYGAEFTRESVRLEQQKGLDQMVEKLEEDISRNALVGAGAISEDPIEKRAQLEAQRELVDKLREVKATGRVVLDLTPNSGGVKDLPEIALEDGDRFVVPYRPATVEMLGALYNKNSFLYRREERVEDYLRRAGGPTRDADRSRIFVIRADGSVLSKQSVKGLWNGGFNSLRLMPGDAIVVPERLNQGAFLKGLRDWSQVFSQFALGAAAVRVIQ
jgi:protein involved in polysaccharide export with SLBB domain